jgi:hypothetical protein
MELQEARSMDFAPCEREASSMLPAFFDRRRLTLVQ